MSEATPTQTLIALEQRLQRVAFLLHGDPTDAVAGATNTDESTTTNNPPSIASRLQRLEKSLQVITAQSASAAEVLRLHKQYPTLWQDDSDSDASEGLDGMPLAALVLAHTPSYHTTAAQLTSLNDLPVPDSSFPAALIAQEPRIQRARERQEIQARKIAHLRQQSVALIGRWYELGMVAMGDCWGEWEARLLDTERTVRRAEATKRREDEAA